jgi:hypothetical protein
MKKKFLFPMVLIIVLALSGCDKDGDGGNDPFPAAKGKLTVNGLGNFNNKYVYASGLAGGNALQGIIDATSSSFKLAKIANAKVEVPLYVPKGSAYSAYSGNDAVTTVSIYILDVDTLEISKVQNVIYSNFGSKTVLSGTFSSGNMTVVWGWSPYTNYPIVQLMENQWVNSSLEARHVTKYFTFTATGTTQYVYNIGDGSEDSWVSPRLYDNDGNDFYPDGSTHSGSSENGTFMRHVWWTVIPGQKYYIGCGSGDIIDFKITFNSSGTPPALP